MQNSNSLAKIEFFLEVCNSSCLSHRNAANKATSVGTYRRPHSTYSFLALILFGFHQNLFGGLSRSEYMADLCHSESNTKHRQYRDLIKHDNCPPSFPLTIKWKISILTLISLACIPKLAVKLPYFCMYKYYYVFWMLGLGDTLSLFVCRQICFRLCLPRVSWRNSANSPSSPRARNYFPVWETCSTIIIILLRHDESLNY